MAIAVTIYNIDTDLAALKMENGDKMSNIDVPAFELHKENIATLRQTLEPFQGYQNLLIIGNGGSIWSFMAYWQALGDKVNGKSVVTLTDMEPDQLAIIKAKYPKDSSLIVVISKSGSTVGVIENIFAFWDYEQLFVTDPSGPIGQIGESRQATVISHPNVGGRYAGLVSTAYVPAILAGLPVEAIEKGAREAYETYRNTKAEQNPALEIALQLFNLEKNGYTEIFLPIYSNFLQTFGTLITQLIHESFGKDGKGLTVAAAQAPESQHHTNQRFFGGRRNMVGCFIHVEKENDEQTAIAVPESLKDLPLRVGKMGDIDGLKLAASFRAEYSGTFTDAQNQSIPLIDIAVNEVSGYTVGQLLALWHYVTVYSSILRAVDPYDQPQVEASKVISFEQRLQG